MGQTKSSGGLADLQAHSDGLADLQAQSAWHRDTVSACRSASLHSQCAFLRTKLPNKLDISLQNP